MTGGPTGRLCGRRDGQSTGWDRGESSRQTRPGSRRSRCFSAWHEGCSENRRETGRGENPFLSFCVIEGYRGPYLSTSLSACSLPSPHRSPPHRRAAAALPPRCRRAAAAASQPPPPHSRRRLTDTDTQPPPSATSLAPTHASLPLPPPLCRRHRTGAASLPPPPQPHCSVPHLTAAASRLTATASPRALPPWHSHGQTTISLTHPIASPRWMPGPRPQPSRHRHQRAADTPVALPPRLAAPGSLHRLRPSPSASSA